MSLRSIRAMVRSQVQLGNEGIGEAGSVKFVGWSCLLPFAPCGRHEARRFQDGVKAMFSSISYRQVCFERQTGIALVFRRTRPQKSMPSSREIFAAVFSQRDED